MSYKALPGLSSIRVHQQIEINRMDNTYLDGITRFCIGLSLDSIGTSSQILKTGAHNMRKNNQKQTRFYTIFIYFQLVYGKVIKHTLKIIYYYDV